MSDSDAIRQPHVVIVGGGFGGMGCARTLGGAPVRVTVVDRNNYNLFSPLLYQVATAALSPADIAQPIRKLLKRQPLTDVMRAEVVGIDYAGKQVLLAGGKMLSYDRLVLACGSSYSYFGHDEWAGEAPAVKTIEDALRIRARLLTAYERAEVSQDPAEQAFLLSTIIVGGGPTGVEMAGAIADLTRFALKKDFRHIRADMAHITLIEAGPRLLAAFPESLAAHARKVLERHAVTVMTGEAVRGIERNSVRVGELTLKGGTLIWAAGVQASPAGRWLGVEVDRAGRLPVGADLSVTGHPDIYAIGDTAAAIGANGKPLPALAQVAKQQGLALGRALRANILQQKPMPAFHFHDRGNTAVISSGAAVYDFRGWHLSGFVGWAFWALIHVYLLTGFRNRILVATQWLWRLATFEPGARLITGNDDPHKPAPSS